MRGKEWNAAPGRWGMTACCRHRRRQQGGLVTGEEGGWGQQGLHTVSRQSVERGGGRRIGIPIRDWFHLLPLRHELSPRQQLAGKGLRTWPAAGTLPAQSPPLSA